MLLLLLLSFSSFSLRRYIYLLGKMKITEIIAWLDIVLVSIHKVSCASYTLCFASCARACHVCYSSRSRGAYSASKQKIATLHIGIPT